MSVNSTQTSTNPGTDVAYMTTALHRELKPSTEISRYFVDRAAVLVVRLRRCMRVEQQVVDGSGKIDSSPEAILAWKYEMATQRSLFKTIAAIREIEDKANPLTANRYQAGAYKELASSLKSANQALKSNTQPVPAPVVASKPAVEPLDFSPRVPYSHKPVTNEVNFAIGKKP